MTTDALTRLLEPSPLIVIEAPAGHGKTHQGVLWALRVARQLRPSQEVLVLTHTNAAVLEFRRRASEVKARVRASTLDSFALELLQSYALHLGFPEAARRPFRGEFGAVAPLLADLWDRAPAIPAALARHYPYALFDEHQDASPGQHRLAQHLVRTGVCQVRVFGDPMQAIFDFESSEIVPWDDVAVDAGEVMKLTDPRRWDDHPRLGEWIADAREKLMRREAIDVRELPEEVSVRRVRGLPDVHPGADAVQPSLVGPLFEAINSRGNESLVVLARNRSHLLGIHRATRRKLRINEGRSPANAVSTALALDGVVGNARAMCSLLIDTLAECASGFTKQLRTQALRCIQEDGVNSKRQRLLLPMLNAMSTVYESPTVTTWAEALRTIANEPPQGVKVELHQSIRALCSMRHGAGEASERLQAALAARVRKQPRLSTSTVHSAKGQEYDHVVIAHCSATPFPATDDGRRLLYVAMSRARRSLLFLLSDEAPSPLIEFPANDSH